MKLYRFALCFALACGASPVGLAAAFSSGVSSLSLGPSGCNAIGCHGTSPGLLPSIAVTGPTTVSTGSTNEYTLIITSLGSQLDGGLNASSLLGEFMLGGAETSGTRTITGPGGKTEITHMGRKIGNGTDVRFSFLWEAPLVAGPASLDVWGNAVNGASGSQGDGAAFTSVAITVQAPAIPAPGTSPWAQAALIALLLAAGSLFLVRRRAPLF